MELQPTKAGFDAQRLERIEALQSRPVLAFPVRMLTPHREAITRLERGEDPDTVSADMDSIIEGGADPFAPGDRGRKPTGTVVPPTKDKTLYDLKTDP